MTAMERTRAWIVRELGLASDLLAREPVAGWLAQRAHDALPGVGDASIDAIYADLLAADRAEAERVRATVAVPETWLFRGRESFEFLRGWLRRRRRPSVRMLSAGCASGAEPLSMVSTAVAAGIVAERCSVDAVDANAAALEALATLAPSGLMLRESAPAWAAGLRLDERDPSVDPSLLRSIRPLCADLRRWAPEGTYDAIFCRHLLIYLEPEARRELLDRLVAALAPDGLLVVGAVEATLVPRSLRPLGPVAACAFERGERIERTARRAIRAERSARPSRDGTAPTERSARPARTEQDEERRARLRAAAEPTSIDAHRALGEVLLRGGRLGEAESSLRKALYLDREDERTLVLLAELVARTGRAELAERYRLRALDAHLRRA